MRPPKESRLPRGLIPRVARLADAFAVDRRGEPEQIPARQVGEQERMAAVLEQPGDVAGEQRLAFVVSEIARRDGGGWISLDRVAERAVVQRVAADLVDG